MFGVLAAVYLPALRPIQADLHTTIELVVSSVVSTCRFRAPRVAALQSKLC